MIWALRIAFCTPGSIEFSDYGSGNLLGTEHQVWGLARALARRGHEVFIFRRWHQGTSLQEVLENVNVVNIVSPEFRDTRLQGFMTKSRFSASIRKCLRAINPDVTVLTELLTALPLISSRGAKVFVAHNPPSGLGYSRNFVREAAKRLLEHKVFKNCAFTVALNQSVLEGLAKRGYETVLIPNAVDISKYPLGEVEESYVLSAGRFVRTKGIHVLLQAYSEIDSTLRQQFSLMIIGYGPEKKHLRRKVYDLGLEDRVAFVEWQPNPALIGKIAKCAVFVIPSLFEVFPVTLIEAMACGKAVVSSDIPGPSDIIEHAQNGMLFEPGNVKALKGLIETTLKDRNLRLRLGVNARKRVERGFTFEEIAPRYERILLIAGRRRDGGPQTEPSNHREHALQPER